MRSPPPNHWEDWHGAGVALLRSSRSGNHSIFLFQSAESGLLELPFGGRECHHASPPMNASEELFEETCALVEIPPEQLERIGRRVLSEHSRVDVQTGRPKVYKNVLYVVRFEDFDRNSVPNGFYRNLSTLQCLRRSGVYVSPTMLESASCEEISIDDLPRHRNRIRDRDWQMIQDALSEPFTKQ